MKYNILKQISAHLSQYSKIDNIYRVDNNIIKIIFNGDKSYFFDLTRGDSKIYKRDNDNKVKELNSPFDVTLQKRIRSAQIKNISIFEGDRVIKFALESVNKYKIEKLFLQFEFTSRNTNMIIYDENSLIIEALRHIDISTSTREIKPNKKLIEIPQTAYKSNTNEYEQIVDIEKYLYDIYSKDEEKILTGLKNTHIKNINKKINTLEKEYKKLDSPQKLYELSLRLNLHANLLLNNIDKINLYQDKITLQDYAGDNTTIEIPNGAKTPSHAANILFARAKKFKAKSLRIHIEEENLQGKIIFYQRLKEIIEKSISKENILKYIPQKSSKNVKAKKENFLSFFLNGYKIMLGRNSRENTYLLEHAKATDMWFHIKDIPSSHVIVKSNKKELPQKIIEEAAILCVDFSNIKAGDCYVDYTQRRNVKIIDGSNVNYVNYKSICMVADRY